MGEADVDRMLARLPARMFMEWLAFYRLEPFGGDAAYLGHAITASTIANVNRAKGKKAAKVEDFMPKFAKAKPQTVEEQIRFAAMITAAHGGTVDLPEEDEL